MSYGQAAKSTLGNSSIRVIIPACVDSIMIAGTSLIFELEVGFYCHASSFSDPRRFDLGTSCCIEKEVLIV